MFVCKCYQTLLRSFHVCWRNRNILLFPFINLDEKVKLIPQIMIGSFVTEMVTCKAVRGMNIAFAKNSHIAVASFVL